MAVASREMARARMRALRARRARLLGLTDIDDDDCWLYDDGGLASEIRRAETAATLRSNTTLAALFGAPTASRSRRAEIARRLLISNLLNTDD